MFDRLEKLIGKDKLECIKSKKILVLGCGGVGGHAIEALVRSGIQNLTIVDKDVVDITNLNRQIIALHSTIGLYKVDVLKARLEDINKDIHVEAIQEELTEETIQDLNLEKYDYIIDAIDDVKVKVAFAKRALHEDLKLVVSTGTARKLHPELLKMTTLDKTSYDPLARKMRNLLKGEKTNKIVVLASEEQPIDTGEAILGSSAFVPSSGGLLIASFVINDIIQQNTNNEK